MRSHWKVFHLFGWALLTFHAWYGDNVYLPLRRSQLRSKTNLDKSTEMFWPEFWWNTDLLKIRNQKRPPIRAGREHCKVQEVNTPVITAKARSDKLIQGSSYKSTLDRVDLVTTYWPNEWIILTRSTRSTSSKDNMLQSPCESTE